MRILVSKFFIFLIVCIVLAGCTTAKKIIARDTQKPVQTKTASVSKVDLSDPQDPLAQHLAARIQVDPNSLSGNEAYTKKADPKHPLPDPMPFRVLKLERQMDELKKNAETKTASSASPVVAAPLIPASQKNEIIKYAPYSSPDGAVIKKVSAPKEPVVSQPIVYHGDDLSLMDVRVGAHPGKARIVLDVTQAAKFVANVDNAQKVLVVEIPGASIATQTQRRLENKSISGYMAQTTDKGLALAIGLKEPSKLVLSTILKGGPHGHRIVLDLAPL